MENGILMGIFLYGKRRYFDTQADEKRAPGRNRTGDLNLTMVALYRLSYKGTALATLQNQGISVNIMQKTSKGVIR